MDAEVALCSYVPAGWSPGTRTIVRRVKVNRSELSADTRSRRRRTIDPNQVVLLETGEAEVAYAYGFIVTNLDGDICDIEAWFRKRALVEEKLKDGKLGLALRHLPWGYEAVNATWMWAVLVGLNISSWLQALTGHDQNTGRAHAKRLRRELVCVPARVTRQAAAPRSTAHPRTTTATSALPGLRSTRSSPPPARRSRRGDRSLREADITPRGRQDERPSATVLDLAHPRGRGGGHRQFGGQI
jgi:hypothetical protein